MADSEAHATAANVTRRRCKRSA